MAIPTSREDLKQYCLRALGAPVLEINVDDDQLEDRIDECLDYWRLYHYEGIEEIYLKQKIRASTLTLSTGNAGVFGLNEPILGLTSGATAVVTRDDRMSNLNTLIVKNVVGNFAAGEIIQGTTHTSVLATSNWVTLGEYDNRYITIPDYVYGISDVLSIGQASSSKNIFDLQYQLRLNDLYDLTSTSIIYYTTVMQHLDLLDWTLNGKDSFRFNRLQDRMYLDINWQSDIALGDYVIIKAYRAMDPSQWTKIWNEQWLKRYVTAQFKKQWAVNIKKFSGIQLPGGVTLDGDKLYLEATQEIAQLEDDLQNKSAPLNFMMG
jgi:hypothetical protein